MLSHLQSAARIVGTWKFIIQSVFSAYPLQTMHHKGDYGLKREEICWHVFCTSLHTQFVVVVVVTIFLTI